ncbi:GDP-fucose transporter [Plasmodium cynomolgi strain B]|uniref:GDP-fucose transporter n=1 Tax=Plasmodium cynomolgi (strain B) TaxID=1120755 RepID=K6UQA5_PLACD|nr:GDP-fucose transporter [Plasmodium cynomolgi strain B]GAB64979.1 GDP-fucose transporter [Plasmodium cynomolgi strain B]
MKHNVAVVSSIGMYLLSSVTSVFVNKYVLMEGSVDTVLLIFIQHLSCLLPLHIFKSYLMGTQDKKGVQEHMGSLYEGLKQMWLIIASFNFTLIFGNTCLKYTNISSYQLARSMTLPFNFLFSYFFFKQINFTFLMIFACMLVSAGFFVFSVDAVSTNFHSVLYGTTVSIVQAIHLNLLKKKLMVYQNKTVMLYYNILYSSIILFIYLSITGEFFSIFRWSHRVCFYLALSCISSIFVTFSSFLCIHYTDNVVYNMFGNVKSTLQTFISKFYHSEELNVYTLVGILLTTLGSFLYTYSSEYARKQKVG